MPHRIAVLGVGLMGERMIQALTGDDRFEVVAAFDPDDTRLHAMAERFHFSPRGSEAELLALPDLACVYIASPPKHHVDSAIRAIEHGIPVYLEKPLAASIADAERLDAVLSVQSVPAVMHFPFSTLPALPRIERELSLGIAGAIERIEVILHFSQWPRTWHKAGEWLQGGEEGGFLREVFSHFAYLTHRLCGALTVETVARRDEDRAGGCELMVTATLRAGAKKIPVTLIGGVGGAAPDFNRWTLYGKKRSYRLEDWSRMSISDGEEWGELLPDETDAPTAWAGQRAALDAWLRGEKHPLPTPRDGLEVARVVEALRGAPAME